MASNLKSLESKAVELGETDGAFGFKWWTAAAQRVVAVAETPVMIADAPWLSEESLIARGPAPHQRLERTPSQATRGEDWSDQRRGAVDGLTTALVDDFPPEVEIRTTEIGRIRLCSIKAAPHRSDRSPAPIPNKDPRLVKVVLQIKGRLRLQQDGCAAMLQPGQWAVFDTARAAFAHDEAVELMALLMPREELLGRRDLLRGCPRVFSWAHGVARVAHDYIESLLAQSSTLDPDFGPDVGQVAMDLVRMGLDENLRGSRALTVREMLRARLRAYIARTLKDPALSIDMIASAHGCTKRYVHMIFAEGEETLSQYILNLRLDRCRDDLRRPALAQRSITEVAFSWGFNSSTHFSRVFRGRFGVSPSEYRAVCREAGAPRGVDSGGRAPARPDASSGVWA